MATMDSRILSSQLFSQDQQGNYFVSLSIGGINRAFAGCVDNINTWTIITQTDVTVYCSAMPSSDVFVILESS